MSAWQPIETAPKDGTKILVFVDGEIKIAHWETDSAHAGWDKAFVPLWVGFSCMDSYFNEEWQETEPTHWMPLPPLP